MTYTLPLTERRYTIEDERHPYEQDVTVVCELRKNSEGEIEWSISVDSERDGGVAYGYGATTEDALNMFEEILESFAGATSDYLRQGAIDFIRERVRFVARNFSGSIRNP